MCCLHIPHNIVFHSGDVSLRVCFCNRISFYFTFLGRGNSKRAAGNIHAHSIIRIPVAEKHHEVNMGFIGKVSKVFEISIINLNAIISSLNYKKRDIKAHSIIMNIIHTFCSFIYDFKKDL